MTVWTPFRGSANTVQCLLTSKNASFSFITSRRTSFFKFKKPKSRSNCSVCRRFSSSPSCWRRKSKTFSTIPLSFALGKKDTSTQLLLSGSPAPRELPPAGPKCRFDFLWSLQPAPACLQRKLLEAQRLFRLRPFESRPACSRWPEQMASPNTMSVSCSGGHHAQLRNADLVTHEDANVEKVEFLCEAFDTSNGRVQTNCQRGNLV